jgi:hypothetical protein
MMGEGWCFRLDELRIGWPGRDKEKEVTSKKNIKGKL